MTRIASFSQRIFIVGLFLLILLTRFTSTVFAQNIAWQGNGTTEGYCSNISTDASVNGQDWLFILSSPGEAPYELNAVFDPAAPVSIGAADKKGNGAVHFTVNTAIGAKLITASATGGTSQSVLTVSHCVKGIDPLVVTKTATTSYDREWSWDIDKSANTTDLGLIGSGELRTVSYTVTVMPASEDIDHRISGNITITNPSYNPEASINTIDDALNMTGEVDISCDTQLPALLAPGSSIYCTYDAPVASKADSLNTVTVTTTNEVPGNSAEAAVVWSDEPTTETDECVFVGDTNPNGPDTQVCAGDTQKTFTYDVTFSKDLESDVVWGCTQTDYTNTAQFETNDTGTSESDQVSITGSVICFCALSQGYWKTHGTAGPAPYDPTWDTAKNNTFYSGGENWEKIIATSSKDGNAYYILARQYIAVALNILKGGTLPSDVQFVFNSATVLLSTNTPQSVAKMKANNPVRQLFLNGASILGNWIDVNHCAE